MRTDIPYQPHVTIASSKSHSAAKALSDEIGEFDIPGSLRTLALVSVADGAIRQQKLFPLL